MKPLMRRQPNGFSVKIKSLEFALLLMNNKELKIQENICLAPLTTLEVGGAARYFVEAATETEVADALRFAETNNRNVFILGGGSNLLVGDNGFDGLVLKLNLTGIEFRPNNTNVSVTAGAGENWDEFVKICVERNLAGVECLSGIPGTIGATPVQNVGAYGQEVAETIGSVRVLDRQTKEIKNLTNSECKFAYRTSIFNTTDKNQFIILSVTFNLTPGGKPNLRYADLQKYFAGSETEPTLADARAAVLTIRAAKSMVISASDENRRSAGSFFKNPVVNQETFNKIEAAARKLNLIAQNQNVPHYPTKNGDVKIPAAWLIEKSGFTKGYAAGNVGLSTNHTLAIINRGNATAAEIIGFVEEIQTKVRATFAVELQPEPIWLGLESS